MRGGSKCSESPGLCVEGLSAASGLFGHVVDQAQVDLQIPTPSPVQHVDELIADDNINVVVDLLFVDGCFESAMFDKTKQ